MNIKDLKPDQYKVVSQGATPVPVPGKKPIMNIKDLPPEEVKVVSQETPEAPVEEAPKEGLGKRIAKAIISPVATMVARPLQLGAELVMPGDNTEAIDRFSREKLGGFVAPVPKNASDFVKDVGRGAETVAFGLGGGVVKNAAGAVIKQGAKQTLKKGMIEGAKAGGIGGAGAALEEGGSDTTLGDVAGSAAIGAGFGAAVPVAFAGASKVVNKVRGGFAARAENRALLEAGVPDARVATKTLEQGKVVTDDVAKEAVRQGVPEADVALIKMSSEVDKSKMTKMLNTRKNQLTNKRVTERATDVVGDTFIEKIAKPIEKLNKEAGAKLDIVARRLAGKKIDPTPAVTSFANQLDGAGITVRKNGTLNFKNSNFEGLKGVQQLITNVWNRAIRVSRTGDALQLHRTKSYIDEIVNYGKETEGLSGKAQSVLKKFRHDIDAILDQKFAAYNEANTVYADTINELSKIAQAMGKNFRIGESFADARAGTVMRRILSNTQSRSSILQLLESSQSTLKKYGIKLDEDIISQAQFADTLEKMLGPEANTSLAGEIVKGLETFGSSGGFGGAQQVGSAVSEVARGGLVRGAIKTAGLAADALRGINQENKIKALEELLKAGIKKGSNIGRKLK